MIFKTTYKILNLVLGQRIFDLKAVDLCNNSISHFLVLSNSKNRAVISQMSILYSVAKISICVYIDFSSAKTTQAVPYQSRLLETASKYDIIKLRKRG